jgi:hypothetical protein
MLVEEIEGRLRHIDRQLNQEEHANGDPTDKTK